MLTTSHSGLTTGESPYLEQAKQTGQLYIQQPYELYSEENHSAWRSLYARMAPRWQRYANEHYLEGIASLCLDPNRVPRLEDVNRFLKPLTGFRAKAVAGYIPAFLFFDCLRNREFPTTITIRRSDNLDYLPEPDIFHDIAGHVPMHTDKLFAEALVRFGECAHTAAGLVSGIRDPHKRLHCLENILRGMARFFWFTVEFGLMRSNDGPKVYGSGLLLEWAINQAFEIDRYQPLLFIVDSFDHLFSLVDQLDHWMKAGRLDNVAPGAPAVNEQDLQSFLDTALS
jgi:phenylalanine-4-hydroxylase